MKIEIVGKFFDNHSLSIINREIATRLGDRFDVYITPVDPLSNQARLPVEKLRKLNFLIVLSLDHSSKLFKFSKP